MKKYLFVCGNARSGTSMMATALNNSPQIVVGMERYLLRHRDTGRLEKSLFEKERFLDVRKGDTYYDALDTPAWRASAEAKYDSCELVGDKIPRLFESVPMLLEQFDQPKIVFLLRNVFDVAASYKARAEDPADRLWPATRGALKALDEWNRALEKALPFARNGQIHVVLYEDAVSAQMRFVPKAPDGNLQAEPMDIPWRRLSRYLGVDIPIPLPRPRRTETRALADEECAALRKGADWGRYESLVDLSRPGELPDKYSNTDRRALAYEVRKVPGVRFKVRAGGDPTRVCLGSAAAFGRFAPHPYPARLGAVNLGFGGARPETYLMEPGALGLAARAEWTVIEVMSARGYETSLFRPLNAMANLVAVKDEWREDRAFERLPRPAFVEHVWTQAFALHPEAARDWIRECQLAWIADVKALVRRAKNPVLLWFSQRVPVGDCRAELDYFFPHFIDRWCLNQLDAPLVEVVSTRGLPQTLRDHDGVPVPLLRGTSEPCVNTYYPSPEMHEEAAGAVRRWLGSSALDPALSEAKTGGRDLDH